MSDIGPARCGHARHDGRITCDYVGCYNRTRNVARPPQGEAVEEPRSYRTRTGRVLTEADIEALAAEAERGYDVSELVRRATDGTPATEPLVHDDPVAEIRFFPGRRPTVREDVEALADAPAFLRALVNTLEITGPPAARLRRYAAHLDDLLDRVEGYQPWKVYLLMAAIFTTAMAAGFVAAMAVISR